MGAYRDAWAVVGAEVWRERSAAYLRSTSLHKQSPRAPAITPEYGAETYFQPKLKIVFVATPLIRPILLIRHTI